MRATLTTSVLLVCGSLAACGDNLEGDNEETTESEIALFLNTSNFEIDESANLKLDSSVMGKADWATVMETRATDTPTGANDNSYKGGSKEDDACPAVETGSIPNNKSDLQNFGVYIEPGAGGSLGYMHLFWRRVQDPTGTTLMDFEFNQSRTKCGGSDTVNVVRTTGDILLEYLIDQGGARATITIRRWTAAGAWGSPSTISGVNGAALGTLNSAAIPANESDGLGAMSARTFGEASVDLTAIFPSNQCVNFGSAMVKSRSSDAFTSALKDFIAPTNIELSNCGKVIIRKQTLPDGLTDTFSYTHNVKSQADPTPTTTTFSLQDNGSKEFANVLQGTGYSVTESDPGTGFSLTNIDCSASTGVTPTTSLVTRNVTFAIDAATDILDCTFTNTRQTGAIKITKTRKHAALGTMTNVGPHAGVTFTVTGGNLPMAGSTVVTDANGEACIDGLNFSSSAGNYTVTETVPTGYAAEGTGSKTVTVTNVASCTSGTPDTVSFLNTPLTDITVSVNSQVNGGTASTIQCVPGMMSATSTGSDGDGSVTLSNLMPGTYTCTVIVDP